MEEDVEADAVDIKQIYRHSRLTNTLNLRTHPSQIFIIICAYTIDVYISFIIFIGIWTILIHIHIQSLSRSLVYILLK